MIFQKRILFRGITSFIWIPLLLIVTSSSSSSSSPPFASSSASSSVAAADTADKVVPGIPHSKVIHLTESNFHTLVTTDPANGLWFLKLYAPWCGHCQQLAPILEDIALYLKGKMAIGKIDCTVERKLCSQFHIDGYPTLKIYRDGSYFDYPGKRDHDSIITFGEKMSSYSVQMVYSYAEILHTHIPKSDTGVVFVAYDSQATATTLEDTASSSSSSSPPSPSVTVVEQFIQSTPVLQVFGQVARMMQAYANFIVLHPSSSTSTTWKEEFESLGIPFSSSSSSSFIAQVQLDTHPLLFPTSTTSLNTTSLLDFVKTYNIPLITFIDSNNFRSISHKGKPLAIAIINPEEDKETSDTYMVQWKEYAKTGPRHILDSYIFSCIDGKKWNHFLQQFSSIHHPTTKSTTFSSSPQILILDVPNRKYWIDETYTMSIEEFMHQVNQGNIPYHIQTNTPPGSFIAKIEEFMFLYAPYSFIVAILILGGIIYVLTMSCFEYKEEEEVIVTMNKKNK